jgi:hypothetical protein
MAKKTLRSPRPNNPHFDPAAYAFPGCREQHIWKPRGAVHDLKAKKGFRIRECENCGMKVHTILQLDPASPDYGRTIDRRYSPPKGYKIKGGIDWHDRALLMAQIFMGEVDKTT